MQDLASKSYDFTQVCSQMQKICPGVIDAVLRFYDEPVENYAAHLYREVPLGDVEDCQKGRNYFYAALKDSLSDQLNPSQIQEAIEDFKKGPVLQTGPHCQLLLDKGNFFSALFSSIGISATQGKYYFLANCATPTLQCRAHVGPAWLNFCDTHVNVLGLSRSTLTRYSTYCFNEPVSFKMITKFGTENLDEVTNFIDHYKAVLQDTTYPDAITAFNKGNQKLWANWDNTGKITPVFLDERFYARLLVYHLKDSSSFIYKLFTNYKLQQQLTTEIKKATQLPYGEMIPTQTDFLWYVAPHKIKPITFTEKQLIVHDLDEPLTINKDIDCIIDLLEKHILIPNVFTIVLMDAFLGNIRMLGGLHQVVYIPLYAKILCNILDENDPLRQHLLKTSYSEWGTHVLNEDIPIMDLMRGLTDGHQLEQLQERFRSIPLKEMVRDFYEFRSYHRWHKLIFT